MRTEKLVAGQVCSLAFDRAIGTRSTFCAKLAVARVTDVAGKVRRSHLIGRFVGVERWYFYYFSKKELLV